MSETIDENLYSRQLYVLGIDAMTKIVSSSVLISGMGGLGVEIAKNVILAGIKNVTIHDTRNVTIGDIAAQFYLNESMIGTNRAVSCCSSLVSLNSYVSVSVDTNDLTDATILKYNCVVITDWRKFTEIKHISELCHQNNIKLIICDTRGVFGYIFSDFGEEFISNDPTGERPSRFLISMITNSKEGKVTCHNDELHNLSDGDTVRFEEVEGMTELNNKEFHVKVISSRQFTIGDTTQFGQYKSEHKSGYGNQVIVPKRFHYETIEKAIKHIQEKVTVFDWGCFGRDQQVILAFLSMSKAVEKANTNLVSLVDIITAAKEINAENQIVDAIDEQLFGLFYNGIGSVISPTCAVFGGIVGQEVIKAVSSKFTPIDQFLGIGYIESLPKEIMFTQKGDRYDAYRAVFGDAQQEAMQKLRYFMIGAGALGCEMLKNWALMGVASAGEGRVFITDMDSIERSNLNRQFLFRDKDIGKMKSTAAAEAAISMNKNMNIDAHTNRVGAESEAVYNDTFFNSLSGVCNALDNVITRLYSDSQCIFYKKPMLESGTLGTKAHYQVVIPHLTESYASMSDPPEKEIPQCTLHNFPSTIDHCCMWSRDVFAGIFEKIPESINKFIEDDEFIPMMQKNSPGDVLPTLHNIKEFMITHKLTTYEDCARWARGKYEELFVDKINELIKLNPRDCLDPKTGMPFWTGPKRYPTPIPFSTGNKHIAQFIKSCADILARIFSIPFANGDAVELAAGKPPIKPTNLPRVTSDDMASSDQEEIDALMKELQPIRASPLVKQEEFDKDDDSNEHIDFVSSAANIRAIIFEITPSSKLEIKRISGKIIPAIATTTAMICGLVCLEMYKVHSIIPKELVDFRSGFINIGIGQFAISEPGSCKEFTCVANNSKYNIWTSWDIEGDITCGEFIEQAKKKFNVTVNMLTIGKSMIYMSSMAPDKLKARLGTKITDILVKELKQQPLNKDQMFISATVLCVDDDFNIIETPQFRLKVK